MIICIYNIHPCFKPVGLVIITDTTYLQTIAMIFAIFATIIAPGTEVAHHADLLVGWLLVIHD